MGIIKTLPFTKPVQEGEIRLQGYLAKHLPDNYTIIANAHYPSISEGQTTFYEYDCIVVAPHGIYNIENKDYSGELYGNDKEWWHKGEKLRNPLLSCRSKTKILVDFLKRKDMKFGAAWIESIVTLSNPNQSKNGFSNSDAATNQIFLLNENLITAITDPNRIKKKPDAIKHLQDKITQYLVAGSTVEKQEKPAITKIEEFIVLRVLHEASGYADYLVESDGVVKQRKRVRVYELSGVGNTGKEERRNQVTNQYNAFQKIQSFEHIANVECRIKEEQVFEFSNYTDVITLKEALLKKNKQFTEQEKISIILQLCRAVAAAHEAGVYHRAINPENILYDNGKVLLANFNQAYFEEHQQAGYTVLDTINQDTATPYQAPDLISGSGDARTDIYSIGIILYELFLGFAPISDFYELSHYGGYLPDTRIPSHFDPKIPTWIDEIIAKTVTTDPDERYESVVELEKAITEKINTTPISGKSTAETKEADTGDSITSTIRLQELLGKGGFSKVFRAYHELEAQEYAVKIFKSGVSIEAFLPECKILKELSHDNIVKYHTCDKSLQNQYYILMDMLHGENLHNYTDSQSQLKMPLETVYQLADEILSALEYLQERDTPIYHRDIKPQNIIWEKGKRFVLVDFNIAVAGNKQDFAGTYKYLPMDMLVQKNKMNWDKSCDPFSFGITLYELVCKRYPWGKVMNPIPNKIPDDPKKLNPKITREFADFLLKSIICNKNKRFTSAKEMHDALRLIGPNGIEEKKEAITFRLESDSTADYVVYLNSLYSQSKYGNYGTRCSQKVVSYDGDTYIDTKLDSELLKDILYGKYRLVIITGNAGDGKTAYIRKIESKVLGREDLNHSNGSSFIINGKRYESNYDGSQDEGEIVNSEVLKKFFKPFYNRSNFSDAPEGRIIAINEGVLADFLGKTPELRYLSDIITDYFSSEGKKNLPDGLMVINLNLRSVTAADEQGESLFRKQLKKICHKELWKDCAECKHRDYCFIKYNVDTFNDYAAGNEVINRLEWLLRMSVYRRELHITMRDLRSFISYLLTANCRCEDIPKLYNKVYQKNPEEYWMNYYFNAVAHDKDPSNDRLLRLLREADVALVPMPDIDRVLYSAKHEEKLFLNFAERKQSLPETFEKRKENVKEENRNSLLRIHRILIRHHFFEGNFEVFKTKHTFFNRMPYKYLYDFRRLMDGDDDVKKTVMRALSKSFACTSGYIETPSLKNYLLIPASRINDPEGKTYRRFPLADFKLELNHPQHLVTYLEYENSIAVFGYHGDYGYQIQLNIGLDLFEMLLYMENGFMPSVNDLQGRFIEMQVFKNQLENTLYQELLITQNNRAFYLVKLDPRTNKIAMKELEEE